MWQTIVFYDLCYKKEQFETIFVEIEAIKQKIMNCTIVSQLCDPWPNEKSSKFQLALSSTNVRDDLICCAIRRNVVTNELVHRN